MCLEAPVMAQDFTVLAAVQTQWQPFPQKDYSPNEWGASKVVLGWETV